MRNKKPRHQLSSVVLLLPLLGNLEVGRSVCDLEGVKLWQIIHLSSNEYDS